MAKQDLNDRKKRKTCSFCVSVIKFILGYVKSPLLYVFNLITIFAFILSLFNLHEYNQRQQGKWYTGFLSYYTGIKTPDDLGEIKFRIFCSGGVILISILSYFGFMFAKITRSILYIIFGYCAWQMKGVLIGAITGLLIIFVD